VEFWELRGVFCIDIKNGLDCGLALGIWVCLVVVDYFLFMPENNTFEKAHCKDTLNRYWPE
jgi:hypothetical protein